MTRNVIIIGSGAAGLTAGIYAARANLSPLLFSGSQPGGQLTITSDVENYPGFAEAILGPTLMEEMRKQAARVGTEIIDANVSKVNLKQQPFVVEADGKRYESKTIIVATGASALLLGLPSESKLMGKGVSACATCDGFFFKNQEVAVVGGGDTAIEEATFLTKFATKVTVIHRRNELRASKIMQQRARDNPKIAFIWDTVVEDVLGVDQERVTGLKLKNLKTGKVTEFRCDGLFVAIGHKPNTDLFTGQLAMNEQGYLITKKSTTETNVAGVFACGDCQDHVYRQAVTAAGTGCMAAIDAERFLQHHSS
ncbi:MAG: thioredoxin-disulfide reductase [Deltaproteobacteria bacterium]|nr:thioredoxin-disulfide reductase [Deltaproteobacteria bacterium]